MFGPSNFNAEDIDDFLAMQRDWGIDGGLRTVPAERIEALRRDAAQACRAVYRHLGLADFTDDHVERAVDAAGSKDLGDTDTLRRGQRRARDPRGRPDRGGRGRRAGRERVRGRGGADLDMTRARVAGDYLQTAAIFDEELGVLSLVTDPNDYAGPGTGYEPSAQRLREIDAIRQERGVEDLRERAGGFRGPAARRGGPGRPRPGPARRGDRRLARRSGATSGAACRA